MKKQEPATHINQLIDRYGDMIFDLCQTSLFDPNAIRQAFTHIIRTLKKTLSVNGYTQYEKAWVLRVTCDHLKSVGKNIRNEMSETEHFRSDTSLSPQEKLEAFDTFFLRLPMDQRLAILLHDKYRLELSLISTALGLPEESIKLVRIQGLCSLEEWIWA